MSLWLDPSMSSVAIGVILRTAGILSLANQASERKHKVKLAFDVSLFVGQQTIVTVLVLELRSGNLTSDRQSLAITQDKMAASYACLKWAAVHRESRNLARLGMAYKREEPI